MRKIEQQLIAAIKAGKNFCGGNTIYTHDTGTVRFHKTNIAEILDGKVISLQYGGYNTATTRSRLRAICHAFGGGSVNSIKGELCYNGKPVLTHGWFKAD